MPSSKIISWNVNGIRSVLKKGFHDFLKTEKPSAICLQEVKAYPEQVALEAPGYSVFWNSAKRAGYAGTVILSKEKPLQMIAGMGTADHDQEGRVITLEYPGYYLVNVYVPNSKRDLSRLGYRQKWDADFLKFLKKLEKKKPVIFCGDMNVAHKETDLTYPEANRRNHGFTDEERAGFDAFIKSGFIDTFREFESQGGNYTWWSPMSNCRARNIGWRIDYFCISKALRPRLKKAFILPKVLGSDHCPVGILLEGK